MRLTFVCVVAFYCLQLRPSTAADFSQTDVFIAGQGGYHTYRIPAIVVATNGAVLAFCEGRKNGAGDAGDIDVVLKRSADGGKTWEGMQVVAEDGANIFG